MDAYQNKKVNYSKLTKCSEISQPDSNLQQDQFKFDQICFNKVQEFELNKQKITHYQKQINTIYHSLSRVINVYIQKVKNTKDNLITFINTQFKKYQSVIQLQFQNFQNQLTQKYCKNTFQELMRDENMFKIQDFLNYQLKISSNLKSLSNLLAQKIQQLSNCLYQPNIVNQLLMKRFYQPFNKNAIQKTLVKHLKILNQLKFQQTVQISKLDKSKIKFKIKVLNIDGDQYPQIRGEKSIQVIENIQIIKPNLLQKILFQDIHQSFSKQQIYQSQKIIQKLYSDYQKSNKNQDFNNDNALGKLAIITLAKNKGYEVIINNQSTLSSKICLKHILTYFMQNYFVYQQTLQENQQWKFDQLLQNTEKLSQFCQWYKNTIKQNYNMPTNKIQIHEITKGSIKVLWSTNQQLKDCKKKQRRCLNLHPYFKYLRLSCCDFQIFGNYQFHSQRTDVMYRGGLPYFQPILGKRYGLKVYDRYKSNKWLGSENQSGQWAVGYHGVSNSNDNQSSKLEFKLESIMKGIQSGQMLKQGQNQMFDKSKLVNDEKSYVGRGVYFSCHFSETIGYTKGPLQITIKKKKDNGQLFIQARIHPKKIRIVKDIDNYWVLPESRFIRPYGIILLKQEHAKKYHENIQYYIENFTYQKYGPQREEFLKKWKDSDQ